ncbi:MAG TPA: TRAP transporter small permease subunit, partial [Bradyrhizobium sp.]|nr:TRAP transporter small permease subunit [Bradyrhizobium sp.]
MAAPRQSGLPERAWVRRADAAIGRLVEWPAAVLVLADISVLFAGVISRFVFRKPLVWSDEAASILFLWLAVLGSVIALRRSEHMRMTALVAKAGPCARALLEPVATCACLAFLLMMVWPAWEYAADERIVTMPALEISNAWRAAALPAGFILMGVFAVLRLLRSADWRQTLLAVAIVAALIASFWVARPLFQDLGRINLLIFFVGVTASSVLAGIPIAFAFGLGTFGYLALTTSMPLSVVVSRMDEGMSHLILLAVPLFVFLGLMMEMAGLARALVDF